MSKRKAWLFLLIALGLAACQPIIRPEQDARSQPITVASGHTFGQTFVPNYDGMSGIRLFLKPSGDASGEMILHLRHSVWDQEDILTTTLPLQAGAGWSPTAFVFPPQPRSRQQDYYFFVEVRGQGSVQVMTAPGDAYLDGALYLDGEAQDAQTTFHLEYAATPLALGLLREFAFWGWVLLLAAWLFVLPGWALLEVLWPEHRSETDGVARVALAAGMGLAVYPLLFLYTDLIGLHLGHSYAWLPPLAALGVLLWRRRHQRIHIPALVAQWRNTLRSPDAWLPYGTLAVVLAALVFTRFWPIRTLDGPMWGDGMHHTMITQLLLDHKGLFNSWEPYAPLESFSYHFGFHTASAVFSWDSGLPSRLSTLWVGQILNILAALAVYPLAAKGRPWAGVIAVLIAGMLSPMPGKYLNWGRYTQLTGQVILPGIMYLSWEALQNHKRRNEFYLLPIFAFAGLGLTHYRVFIFAAAFLLALTAWNLLTIRSKEAWHTTFLTVSGSVFLLSPWLWHVMNSRLARAVYLQIASTTPQAQSVALQVNSVGNLLLYLPKPLWLLLPVAIGFGLWQRDNRTALIVLWLATLALVTNPQWLHLPGQGMITNFAVLIAAYIPASILISHLFTSLASWRWTRYLFPICIAGLSIWAGRLQIQLIDTSSHALLTRPDLRAAQWLSQQDIDDGRFLINGFVAFSGTIVVGSDAGWWLPLLCPCKTTIPPILYASEQTSLPAQVNLVRLTTVLQEKGVASPEGLALLKETGTKYLYVGQQQGTVNTPLPLIKLSKLKQDSFTTLYHQDRVWVLQHTASP